jgi:DNA-binding NarL/FixJ family response regulator
MTKQKTVILWGQNDLLTRAMEMFLKADEKETWHVIRFPESECISALVEQVQKSKPDLVILYPSIPEDASDPLMRLFERQPELRVIADQPESKVITVNLENNEMQVYSKHSLTVRHASDLLSVIEDRYFSNRPI